jgi:GH24 family phage-related lysozyme (muramidase)
MKEAIKLCTEALLHPFEGYHIRLPDGGCKSYPDPASPLGRGKFSKQEISSMTLEQLTQAGRPWTIGWGSTGPDVGPNTVWTREQADNRLESDVNKFVAGMLGLSPLLQNQLPRRQAAILSFCYNCGLGNYRISTLRRRVNEEDWSGASEEIKKWNKAQGIVLAGLTRRRSAESSFLR